MKTQLPVDRHVEAYHRLQRVAGVLENSVSKAFQAKGLTPSQFNTLRILAEHGPLAQRDIANQLLKTGGNVTLVVDHLSDLKLVERNRDTVDRRVIYVSLTPQGVKLYEELAPGHQALIRQAISALPENQVAELLSFLDALHPERAQALG